MEQYQQSVQEYEESEERRVHYQENVRETQEYAAEQEAQLYAGRDTEQKGIRQAAVGVLYADQMARYYGKPLSQLSLEDNQIAISLGSMCNDSKEELGKFFNGEEARLGSISQTYKTVMAAHTMKQIEAAQNQVNAGAV